MSFYGNIKRILSSPYVFDKYYPNRAMMDSAAATDGIYVGRYVLVKYTCKLNDDGTEYIYFDKYNQSQDSDTLVINEYYEANALADIEEYGDTFDATVWQKVYTHAKNDNNNNNPIEKYILVAELKAAVPRLQFQLIDPKEQKLNDNNEIVEEWVNPDVGIISASEDTYLFKMPAPLHLDVGDMNEDFYGAALVNNPAEKVVLKDEDDHPISHSDMFSSAYNHMGWTNYNDGEPVSPTAISDIDTKKLEAKFYALGQMISDIYDVLYGAPANGEAGPRPFYVESLEDILANYDKGLVGILTSIATDMKGDASLDLYGRTLLPGMYYYFASKWCDASEDPDNFIENIPYIIGASSANGGSLAKSQYYINFNATNDEYISNSWN